MDGQTEGISLCLQDLVPLQHRYLIRNLLRNLLLRPVYKLMNEFMYKLIVLQFSIDTEPHTYRDLSQLLDFGLTSDNQVSQVG